MAKAGLITFHFAHHYGAQLQAYATMRAVEQLGMDCEIIDYRLPHTTRTNRLFHFTPFPKAVLLNSHTIMHYGDLRRRYKRFEAFVSSYMKLSPRRYTNLDELRAAPPSYDVYISGSDQIWNPFIFQDSRFDPAFFLAFAGEKKKIAYAPSLGAGTFPQNLMWELEGYLSSYKALSARESSGRSVLEKASGRKVETVLDPTLLLSGEDWGKLANAPEKGSYILCYFISPYEALMPTLNAVMRETGLPLVQLAGMRRRVPGAGRIVLDAGPKEFLGLFRNAAFVVTNSFHGTVFAMQFEKPFMTGVSPRELMKPAQSRIYNLLQTAGLTGRIAGLPETQAWDLPVDYSEVKARLFPAVEASRAYLRKNLLDMSE